jgi:SAM-dependent methyltransferase
MEYRPARIPPLGAAAFGVLDCGCRLHPVVDGIPILLRGPVGEFEHQSGALAAGGATPQQLVRLIRAGREGEALGRCLSYAPGAADARSPGGPPAPGIAGWLARRRVRARLLARRNRLSACDALRFFFGADSPLGEHIGDYFVMRFGQPRHLAALALLSNVAGGPGAVLDVACGAGHLEHYLTRRADPARVVGVDINYFELWIARHWIAPAAAFVCCDARDGLPFADGTFTATFCSDAYHYFGDRASLLGEIRRCAPGGTVVLTRVGNAAVTPNEGRELSVQGYGDEISADGLRVFDEAGLVRDYLARRNPLARARDDTGEADRSKWLSFAWNVPSRVRDPAWDEPDWPHAAGVLGLNPVYVPIRLPGGAVELRFRFPGVWYAFENGAMLAYQPRSLRLGPDEVERLRSGAAAGSLSLDLVRKFVLLGMPERYRGTASAGL